MNWLNDIIGVINNYLWSYVLIVMLIGIGPVSYTHLV